MFLFLLYTVGPLFFMFLRSCAPHWFYLLKIPSTSPFSTQSFSSFIFTEIQYFIVWIYNFFFLTKHELLNEWHITTGSSWGKMKVGSTPNTVYHEKFQNIQKIKYFCWTPEFILLQLKTVSVNNFLFMSLYIFTGISV